MDTQAIQTLADQLHNVLLGTQPEVWLHILRALAKGQPVSITYLTSTLNMSHDNVKKALQSLPYLEYDAAGNILAAGLSLTPTPHRFQVAGKDLYTWCALDALMYPVLLGVSAQAESLCPTAGLPIKLSVTPTDVKHVSPPSTVVSVIVPEKPQTCCDVRDAFCDHVHFLSSPAAAAKWHVAHPDAVILSLEEAFDLGYELARRRLAPN